MSHLLKRYSFVLAVAGLFGWLDGLLTDFVVCRRFGWPWRTVRFMRGIGVSASECEQRFLAAHASDAASARARNDSISHFESQRVLFLEREIADREPGRRG